MLTFLPQKTATFWLLRFARAMAGDHPTSKISATHRMPQTRNSDPKHARDSPGASNRGALNSSDALREGPTDRPPSGITSGPRRDGAPAEKDMETNQKSVNKQIGTFSDPRMNDPKNWQALFLWARHNPCLSPERIFALEVENALGRGTELRKDQCTYAKVVFDKALRLGFIPPVT